MRAEQRSASFGLAQNLSCRDCNGSAKENRFGSQDGEFAETSLVWPDVLKIADEPGEKHTSALGVRTLDLMHASAAISLKAKAFLTYVGRQLALARASGLRAQKL
jgi:hypothetical protein